MDYQQRAIFTKVQGTIVEIVPARARDGEEDSQDLYFSLEDENGNLTNFLVTKDTFILDAITIKEGMEIAFWYRSDAPAPLIYPPQYHAVVAAAVSMECMIDVSLYDEELVNAEHSLQLHIDDAVAIRNANYQIYMGSPANQNLVVTYTTSTRSIPAQTTPLQVVVIKK